MAETCYHCGEPITPELRWQCAKSADGRHEFPTGSVGWTDWPKVADPTGPLALIIQPDGTATITRMPAVREERWHLYGVLMIDPGTIPHPLDDDDAYQTHDWLAILSDPDDDDPAAALMAPNPVAAELGRLLGWYPGPVAGPVVIVGSSGNSTPEGRYADTDVPARVVELARQAGATGLTDG